MSTSLIQGTTSLITSNKLTENNTVLVKGLFTNDLVDREGEVTDAAEFNLEVFKNTATLLRNHEHILDEYGNKESAGKVLKTFPVIISQENPSNSEEWLLKSLTSEDIVDVWPKYKSPNMLVGDRGVYVVAEVIHPTVVKQVLNGELGAFSWSGLTRQIKRSNGIVDLKNIDLLEISLVNIPANPDATFVITDESDPTLNLEIKLKDCSIYQLRYDKQNNSLDNIKRITKNLNIDTCEISESEDSFFIKVGDTTLVDPIKAFMYDLGQFKAVMAPKMMNKTYCKLETIQSHKLSEEIMSEDVTPKTSEDTQVEAIKLYLLDIEAFQKANPKALVSVQKTVMLEEAPVEINFIELPVGEVVAEPVSAVEVEVVETVAEVVESETEEVVAETVVEESVAEVVVNTATEDRLDKLTEAVSSLAAIVNQTIAQTETKEKSLEEAKAQLKKEFEESVIKFKKDEEAMEVQRALLTKTLNKLKAFESSVPEETERTDRVESTKTFGDNTVDAKAYFANKILGGSN